MPYSYEDLLRLYTQGSAPVQGPAPAPEAYPGSNVTEDLYGGAVNSTSEVPSSDFQLPSDPLVQGTPQGGNALPGHLEPPSAASAGLKAGESTGRSVSGEYRGYSEGKYGQVSKQDAELYAKKQQSENAVNAAYDPARQALEQSKTSGVGAVEAKLTADQQRLQDEKDTATLLGGIQQQFTKDEIDIRAREAATMNKRIADYQTSLADFAASKVDPNDFWHGMSGGMRFGSMVSAFVHDFLGAKGIKTSAMDTFNKAIDRNINAQIQNINKKGEVAKGFKQLFELEQARSSSDAETRLRVRGYMLEAAKQHVIANMSSYKSLLATAEGKKALAELDASYAKNTSDLIQHIQDDAKARTQQDLQWVMHKGNLAVEQYKASISARDTRLRELEYNERKAAAAKKSAAELHGRMLVDPADNTAKRVLNEGIGDKEAQNVREVLINTDETNKSIKEIAELVRDNKATIVDEAGVRRWSPEGRKLAEAAIDRLAHSQVKANGEKATDNDVAQYKKMFPLDQVLSTGVQHMYDYAQKTTLDHANTYIRQYSVDLPKEMWRSGGDQTYFAGDKLAAEAGYKEFKRGGKQESITDNAQKLIGSPTNKIDEKYLKSSGFTKEDIDMDFQANTGAKSSRIDHSNMGGLPTGNAEVVTENRKAPAWAAGVFLLSQKAKDGGSQEGAEARTTLEKLATSNYADVQKDPLFKDYDYNEFQLMKKYAQTKVLQFTPSTTHLRSRYQPYTPNFETEERPYNSEQPYNVR